MVHANGWRLVSVVKGNKVLVCVCGKCGGCLRACLPCSICCAYTVVLLVLLPCMEKGEGGKEEGGTCYHGGV